MQLNVVFWFFRKYCHCFWCWLVCFMKWCFSIECKQFGKPRCKILFNSIDVYNNLLLSTKAAQEDNWKPIGALKNFQNYFKAAIRFSVARCNHKVQSFFSPENFSWLGPCCSPQFGQSLPSPRRSCVRWQILWNWQRLKKVNQLASIQGRI